MVSAAITPAMQTQADDVVQVIDRFVAPADAARLYALLQTVEIPSSLFYLEIEAVQAADGAAAVGRYLPASLATFVIAHCLRLFAVASAEIRAHTAGFEIWTTRPKRSTAGRIYLHVDCDEALRTTTGALRTPLLGSVLYLGPETGLVGGETLFVTDPHLTDRFAPFAFHDWGLLSGEHAAVRLVVPEPGRLALFPGAAAHGQGPVVDHPAGQPRIALLVNLWDGRIGRVPSGICSETPEIFAQRRSC